MSDYLWVEEFREAIAAKHPGRADMIVAERIDYIHRLNGRKIEDYTNSQAVLAVVAELGNMHPREEAYFNRATAKAQEMDAQEARSRPQSPLREAWNPAAGITSVISNIANAFTGRKRDHNNIGLG